MSRIKEAMEEVYREGHFSVEKKRETLQKARRKRQTIWTSLVPVTVIVTFCVLLVFLLQPQSQIVNMSDQPLHQSTEPAPRDAIIEIANRKLQFQQIIEDGEITEQEQMSYLQTSDWKLQLAFEKGDGTTYHISYLTEKERLGYADLLFYMREYIYAGEVHEDVVTAFQKTRTFHEIAQLMPIVKQHVLLDYVSVHDERMPHTRWFLNATTPIQISIVIGVITIFITSLVNILTKRNFILLSIQLLALIVLFAIATKPVEQYAAIDETTIFQSSEAVIRKLGINYESARLIDVAQFDNLRAAFMELEGATSRYAVVQFTRDGNDYLFSEVHWLNDFKSWATMTFIRNDGQGGYFVALNEGHDVATVEIKVYSNPTRSITLDVKEWIPMLYMFYLPRVDNSFEIILYDRDGKRIVD